VDWKKLIVTDPEICGGRPRIRDTRLTVEFVLGLKAAGRQDKQILENYPALKPEHMQAIYAYAQAILRDESFLPAA
jgi:uncharacterized protein (DUF433 family)